MQEHLRRTKIVATIGPATSTPERVYEMITAGVNVVRLNFSHGSHQDHAHYIKLVRQEAARAGKAVALLQDLQGPKIRTGPLKGGQSVQIEDGQTLIITTEPIEGDAQRISTTYSMLPQDVSPGDRLFISDGLIEVRVISTSAHEVTGEVIHGGELRPNQGINLPGVRLSCSSVTEKDLEDLAFGLSQGVDYIALSFVRRAEDVAQVKKEIEKRQGHVPVIAKIEKPEAIEVLDDILAVADGVMVARGDLGIEVSPEKVPLLQKHIIQAANRAQIPVITATQMLESMINAPQPTRAEVSDVANAILDGSDAVMLSGETAIGRYPIHAIRMMVRIAQAVEEKAIEEPKATFAHPFGAPSTVPQGIAAAVSALVRTLPVVAICVVTRSGSTARLVSHHRPPLPILAFTPLETTYRRLALLWGIMPIKTEFAHTEEEYYRMVERALLEYGYAKPGERVVITGGHPITQAGPTNFLKVFTVGEGR